MKVLWVIAQISPDMAKILGLPESPFGGWVQNMLNELRKKTELSLSVVGCANIEKEVIQSYQGIKYYILPMRGNNKGVSEEAALDVVMRVQPDVIHIEGTEYSISNTFAKMDGFKNIVSLQGILSGYELYQYGGLLISEMMFSLKNKNFIVGWTLFLRKKLLFDKRIRIEDETIKNAQNLLGRTLWDKAHSSYHNKKATYYECHRLLRRVFYENQWDFNNCIRHTLFVGNGYSALKGAHFALEALSQLQDEFPDIHLLIAGTDPCDSKLGMKAKVGYAQYTKQLIKRLGIEGRVTYLGNLDGDQMVKNMLNSNVYILPSYIENSPNTLAEAMILGMPAIAAYTGGVPSMAIDESEVLFYRADDPTMLAWQIRRIFINPKEAVQRAEKARKRAFNTHDIKTNADKMVNIYREIVGGK